MAPVAGANDHVLAARLDNVRLLSDALSCIYSSSRKAQDVVISVPSAGGLKFAVEQTGCLLASVLLPLGAFAHFSCSSSGSARVRLNLSLLVDCLHIFAGGGVPDRAPTPVRVEYAGHGHPLVLRFHEADSVTVCRLHTVDSDYADELTSDLHFARHDVPNMALLESDALRDALAELDYAGATTAELRLAPTPPRFRFQAPAASFRIVDADDAERRLRDDDGDEHGAGPRKRPRTGPGNGDKDDDDDDDDDPGASRGSARYVCSEPQCSVELADPEDRAAGVFSEFRSARAQTSTYRLELLTRVSRALAMSETCKVQMNADGMLSVVCRMRAVGGGGGGGGERGAAGDHCFTEFLIVADEVGEDDGDEDEHASGEIVAGNVGVRR